MKALILSDIHGSNLKYEQIIDATDPDFIILPGDICSSVDIPSMMISYLTGKKRSGYVRNFYQRFIGRANLKQISTMKTILSNILEFNIPTIAIHGNTETKETRSWLYLYALRNENLYYISDNFVKLHDILFLGHGWVPRDKKFLRVPTPGEIEEDISNKIILDTLGRANQAAYQKILISHSPPHGTPIDFLRHRDRHAGSKSVRNIMDSGFFDGLISGHLHESHGAFKTDKWWAINAGAAVEDRGCLVNLDTLEISWISKIIKNANIESVLYQKRRKLNYD